MFTNIDIILFSLLAGFFKATADVLQFGFNTSWFKKFKGNKYADPKISWKNKHKFDHMFGLIFLITPFSDLWHLCYTLMIWSLLCFGLYYNSFEYTNNFFTILICYISYGVGFEITYFTYKD